LHRNHIADIDLHRYGATVVFARNFAHAFLEDVCGYDNGTFLYEAFYGGRANASGCTGHDRDFAFQTFHAFRGPVCVLVLISGPYQ
jgi:hypothetical protein